MPSTPAPSASASPVVRRDQSRAQIVAAARECFRERGVRATTMEDIALAAGTSRRLLYRAFAGRGEVVEEAIVARMRELACELPSGLDDHASFAEAVVELSVAIVEDGRADTELRDLFEAVGIARLHHMVAGDYPPVAQIVLDTWRPWLTAARISGEIRSDVTDEQVVEWLRGVHLTLILRDDLTKAQERERLARFLLPSLLAPTPPRTRGSR